MYLELSVCNYRANKAFQFNKGIAQSIIARASSANTPQRPSVITPILSVLANKYVIENHLDLITLLAQNAKSARQAAEAPQGEGSGSLDHLAFVYAILSGILRRYSSKKAEPLLEFVREGPALPNELGSQLARRMEMLVAPQTFLTKPNYAVVKPLWMQRVYFELITPVLRQALDSSLEADVRKRYGVAVILMLRHMTFSIYEADADKVLTIAILTAQRPDSPIESLAALDVLQNILL